MNYYIAKIVGRPFDSVVAEVIARLGIEGFGVVTDIDVQALLKAKIGADIPRYRILGACNPGLAYDALKVEERVGVLLPCNVVVRETADRQIEVASVDPVATMERTGNPTLTRPALEVRARLTRVVQALGS
jgi:uncharacterized protein (DUF302 family)